ncbi:putative LOC106145747 [Columba livia]|uniref:Centrosomal protein of 70 kDa n=1 Tax=Columba livia TaxID=8932 RepID=A0A2I0MGJ5_COLLI|nr:putative LOC106145747 [Columba livia]
MRTGGSTRALPPPPAPASPSPRSPGRRFPRKGAAVRAGSSQAPDSALRRPGLASPPPRLPAPQNGGVQPAPPRGRRLPASSLPTLPSRPLTSALPAGPAPSRRGQPRTKQFPATDGDLLRLRVPLQQERAEWEKLNKLLMRHGLKPVSLAAPTSCRNISDMFVLDCQSSLGIRLALKTLLEDTDRHQRMMQGLMETNHSLRIYLYFSEMRYDRNEVVHLGKNNGLTIWKMW